MEKYDVVIVGAGIAGTGLAHNLKEQGYTGSVLVIDKGVAGNNAGHNLRTSFKKVVEKYNLPFSHKYKSCKIGAYDKVYFTINEPYYALDYRNITENLLKRSEAEFRMEKAINVSNSILTTNNSEYKFNHLIDCTGASFFLRKKFGKQIPFRFWLGDLKVIENKTKMKTDSVYYLFGENGFVEEINPFEKTIVQGNWQFTKEVDFGLVRPHDKTLLGDMMSHNPKILKEEKAVLPVAPVLPLVMKNHAFLGDSFGNAMSSTSFGVGVTLDSSEMLAGAIKKGDLKSYEKSWKKTYLESYIRYLVSKNDTYHNSELMKKIKNPPSIPQIMYALKDDPYVFYRLMEDATCPQGIPRCMKHLFPKQMIFFRLLYYAYLKYKYAVMN